MGKKREGAESSKAPLLDTLPFAICTFITTQMFLGMFDEATIATLMSLAVDLDLNSDRNDNKFKYGPSSFHKKTTEVVSMS